jgi:hypothetical protein
LSSQFGDQIAMHEKPLASRRSEAVGPTRQLDDTSLSVFEDAGGAGHDRNGIGRRDRRRVVELGTRRCRAETGKPANCLAIGWFRTEMIAWLMFGDESSERWMKQRTPMGRGGNIDELDGASLYLTSPASSFMTGRVLCADGGWTSA